MRQNINYIGSKYKLLPFLEETIRGVSGDLQDKVFCDLFSGTGIVSRHFEPICNKIISNDIEYYSYVLLNAYLKKYPDYDISSLNKTIPQEGFIFRRYSEGGEDKRLYYSRDNGMKIDGIRQAINKIENKEQFYCAIASLLEAADKVANTTSVYGAYLKAIKKTAAKPITLLDIDNEAQNSNNEVYNEDANILIKKINGDILYLDPPYNSRQYSSNYHLLNTIALYDTFEPVGKTGQRPDNTTSLFCSKVKCLSSFTELIKSAEFKYIFMSYNNEGILQEEDIKKVMSEYGQYSLYKTEYKTYKADSDRNNKSEIVYEYVHILEKRL